MKKINSVNIINGMTNFHMYIGWNIEDRRYIRNILKFETKTNWTKIEEYRLVQQKIESDNECNSL